MRISSAGPALLAALTVAACGGAGSTGSTASRAPGTGTGVTSTRGAVATATATVTRTDTQTVPGSTGPSTGTGTRTPGDDGSGGAGLSGSAAGSASGAASPCRGSGLTLSFLGQQGATGHGELGFALRNTGSGACTTVGYPGVQFLDGDGRALPTDPTHTTEDFFGATAERTLRVAPGQSVSFRLGVTHGVGSSAGCTTAGAVQVIAPNDTAMLRVGLPGGAAECGAVTVSPLQAGDSAYP